MPNPANVIPNTDPPPSHVALIEPGGTANNHVWMKWFDKVYTMLNALQTGRGGITLNTPVALPDLGAGWVTLVADANVLNEPRNVLQDLVSDSIVILITGTWNIQITFSFSHNQSISGRSLQVRLFNLDTGLIKVIGSLGSARDQDYTFYTNVFLVETTQLSAGSRWVVQIGNGDIYTSVTLQSYTFSLFRIGPYQGII